MKTLNPDRPTRLLTTLALSAVLASLAPAIQVYDFYNLAGPPGWEATVWAGPSLNALVGADRLYAAGYTGSRSISANVEIGTASGLHETMGGLSAIISSPTVASYESLHATAMSFLMAGRYSGQDDGALYLYTDASPAHLNDPNNYIFSSGNGRTYQDGIAHGSTLWSGAYGTLANGGFTITASSFTAPYLTAMSNGVNGRTADVVNGSWGTDEASGAGASVLAAGGSWLNAMAASTRARPSCSRRATTAERRAR